MLVRPGFIRPSNFTPELNLCFQAGQDATDAFFGLHRYEVLEKPQYQRLQIGVIGGEAPKLHGRTEGDLSLVPYAEPTWLSPGYHTPYYTEVRFPPFP